jgi:hypothetical protein
VSLGLEIPLGILLAASASADVVTTRQALTHCATCREGNPLMKPFAGSTPALTAVQAGANSGLFLATLKFKEQHRKTWWLPLAVGIGAHTFAAIHNSHAPRTNELELLRRRLDRLEGR